MANWDVTTIRQLVPRLDCLEDTALYLTSTQSKIMSASTHLGAEHEVAEGLLNLPRPHSVCGQLQHQAWYEQVPAYSFKRHREVMCERFDTLFGDLVRLRFRRSCR